MAKSVSTVSDLTMDEDFVVKATGYQELFGLDAEASMFLLKAERLQEKGNYKQAQKFYNKVIATAPHCAFALENARINEELLQEDEQLAGKSDATAEPFIAEMSVNWTGYQDEYDDPVPDELAIEKAEQMLKEQGHKRYLLSLIKNEVFEEKKVDNLYIEWSGRANFRVTLLPDQTTPLAPNKAEEESIKSTVGCDRTSGEPLLKGKRMGQIQMLNEALAVAAVDNNDVKSPVSNAAASMVSSRFADADDEGE